MHSSISRSDQQCFSHEDKCIAAGTVLDEQSAVSNRWYESRLPLTANMQNVKARDLHIQSESIRRANEKPENAALSVTRSMRGATDGNGKLQMHSMVSM